MLFPSPLCHPPVSPRVTLLAKFGSSPFCIALRGAAAALLVPARLHSRTKLVAVDGLFESRYETV